MVSTTKNRAGGSLYLARLHHARVHQPFTLSLSAILTIPSVCAIILGDATSQALANLGAGVYARVMGMVLLSGCLLILWSIIKNKALGTVVGMTMAALGSFLYGFGVIYGLLPFGGIIAGSGFIAIGLGFIMRILTIATIANVTFNALSTTLLPDFRPIESDISTTQNPQLIKDGGVE